MCFARTPFPECLVDGGKAYRLRDLPFGTQVVLYTLSISFTYTPEKSPQLEGKGGDVGFVSQGLILSF